MNVTKRPVRYDDEPNGAAWEEAAAALRRAHEVLTAVQRGCRKRSRNHSELKNQILGAGGELIVQTAADDVKRGSKNIERARELFAAADRVGREAHQGSGTVAAGNPRGGKPATV